MMEREEVNKARYLLQIAYDGTPFVGWQRQKNGLAIQQVIEEVLEKILGSKTSLHASGRTDTGVHATGQMAHFDAKQSVITEKLQHALNALLPREIRAVALQEVPTTFHARFDATRKIYHYHLTHGSIKNPLRRLYAAYTHHTLDIAAMREASLYLVGTHDFTSFASARGDGSDAGYDKTRTIYAINLIASEGELRLEFEGSGFLYKMVRNITGALLAVGKGKLTPHSIKTILSAKDRRKAPPAAPACGLHLVKVFYPEEEKPC